MALAEQTETGKIPNWPIWKGFKVGRNTVTDGGPVTFTGYGADSLLPPVTRSSEGLFSVGLATVTSGGPVTDTGNEPLLPLSKQNYAPPSKGSKFKVFKVQSGQSSKWSKLRVVKVQSGQGSKWRTAPTSRGQRARRACPCSTASASQPDACVRMSSRRMYQSNGF